MTAVIHVPVRSHRLSLIAPGDRSVGSMKAPANAAALEEVQGTNEEFSAVKCPVNARRLQRQKVSVKRSLWDGC